HVTGGGLAANLTRVLPATVTATVDRSTWSPPPIVDLMRRVGRVPATELERTLNMGVGMLAVVAADAADHALRLLADRGVEAWIAGEVASGDGTARLGGSHK